MNTQSQIITDLLAHVASECSAIDREERFDSMLDDCYSFERVGGPFTYMTPSLVLKEYDPVAYRCGVNDYADSEGWIEIDGDYYDKDEVESARESFLDDLESEESDKESEISEGKQTANCATDLDYIESIQQELSDIQAKIQEVSAHSF